MRNLRANLGFLDVAGSVLQLALVDRIQLRPSLVLFVDATQRGDRLFVGGRQRIENHAVRTDRIVEAREALLVDLTQATVEVDLVERLFSRNGALFQHAGQLGPLLERAVNAIEVRERVLLVRFDRQDVAIRLFGLGHVGQLFFEHARQPLADRGLRGGVDALDRQDVGVSVRQRLPATVEHRCQTLDLFASALVQRRFFDGAHMDVERQHRIEEALFGVFGDAVVHGHPLGRVRRVGQLRLAHADQLVPLARRLVQRLENLADFELLRARFEQRLQGVQGVRVLGRGTDHFAISRDRLVQITQTSLVDLAQAELEAEDLFRALTDLALASQHLGQILPALHLREETIQRADGDLILRVLPEHQPIALDCLLEAFELHFVDLRRAQTQLHEALRFSVQLVELRVVQLCNGRPTFDHHG